MKASNSFIKALILCCIISLTANSLASLDDYNVTWDSPGKTSSDSMPIGNGDIALNVWTEPNGDLVFYIAGSDAWSETGGWGGTMTNSDGITSDTFFAPIASASCGASLSSA